MIDSSMDRETKYSWIAVKRQGQWRVISETFTKVQERQDRSGELPVGSGAIEPAAGAGR